VDSQRDLDKMEVDLLEKGNGSSLTSPASAVKGHKINVMMVEIK
jgi:hypothetical protein